MYRTQTVVSVGQWGMSRRPGVTVRRVTATDHPALGDFFAGLSTRTRLLRFFAPVIPTGAMLQRLAGGSGGTAGAEVLIAVRDGVIIGHAMAVPAQCADGGTPGSGPGGTSTADIGVVVADGWQGRGVGSALMRALVSSAQVRGVTTLTMDVRHDNQRVLAMITSHWPGACTTRAPDCLTLRAELPPVPPAPYPGRASRPRARARPSARRGPAGCAGRLVAGRAAAH